MTTWGKNSDTLRFLLMRATRDLIASSLSRSLGESRSLGMFFGTGASKSEGVRRSLVCSSKDSWMRIPSLVAFELSAFITDIAMKLGQAGHQGTIQDKSIQDKSIPIQVITALATLGMSRSPADHSTFQSKLSSVSALPTPRHAYPGICFSFSYNTINEQCHILGQSELYAFLNCLHGT